MTQVSDREILQELAAKPIGNEALQEEAQRVAHIAANGGRPHISAELRETIDRTRKIWLPQGKRSAAEANKRAAEAAAAVQIDLEDAVEKAGGKRGGARL
jgi:hypothetical protein